MMLGTANTSVLTDIANAIRTQNGTSAPISPLDMPAAIRALDGSKDGEPATLAPPEIESGHMSSAVFDEIADAIREQNGLSVEYRPDEMAEAILALHWPTWALIWDDETLELVVGKPVSKHGGNVVETLEVDPTPLTRPGSQSWYHHRAQLRRVIWDESFEASEVTSMALWFYGFENLREAYGFEHTKNVENITQLFDVCVRFDSLYAAAGYVGSYNNSRPFDDDGPLIGGVGYSAPGAYAADSVLHHGPGGVFTDPLNDQRTFVNMFLLDDGRLYFTPGDAPAGATVIEEHRLCCEATYTLNNRLDFDNISAVTTIEIAPEMAEVNCHYLNIAYWFYNFYQVTDIVGLQYLRDVHDMTRAFSSLSKITEIDLSGFDYSHLTDVGYAFYSCSALKTIYADEDWRLPKGVTGTNLFLGSMRLQGGNGTSYSGSNVGPEYLRVDREGEPGYLTAKP